MGACSVPCCSRCCTFFSIFGIIFMVIFGVLFESQGYYILGYEDEHGEFQEYAENCYVAAGIYAAFLIASIAGWVWDNKQKKRRNDEILEKSSGFAHM
mmetsp:Transcript_307/g.398  ORF Transcript_307/g.398 Transcript_307/m.398 type:complete len:98 (-) Transcript_307:43-336(-)